MHQVGRPRGDGMNLLEETIDCIERSGHNIEDIIFLGSEETGHSCSWEEFKKLADRSYDNDFGSAEVANDLIVVFSDGQKLWRGEYDGSEWWEFSTPFKKPKKLKPIISLFAEDSGSCGWCSIEECSRSVGTEADEDEE